MPFKVGTCNSRGGDSKVSHILETLEKYQLDILYLQETHNITGQNIKKIEQNGKWKCHVSPGTQRGRGVLTVANPTTVMNIQQIARDQQGNLLVIEGEIEGAKRMFMNIYAPNELTNRRNLFEKCNDFHRTNRETYFGGDLISNCIENIQLDSINKSQQSFMHKKSAIGKNYGS